MSAIILKDEDGVEKTLESLLSEHDESIQIEIVIKVDGKEKLYRFNSLAEKVEDEKLISEKVGDGLIVSERTRRNGSLFSRVSRKNKVRHGPCVLYHPNGNKSEEGEYLENLKEGEWIRYYTNGNIRDRKTFVKGVIQGELVTYEKDGKLKESYTYKNGILEGPYLRYADADSVYKKGQYVNGLKEGEWLTYLRCRTEKKIYENDIEISLRSIAQNK